LELCVISLTVLRPPRCTPFPYTTLFRSGLGDAKGLQAQRARSDARQEALLLLLAAVAQQGPHGVHLRVAGAGTAAGRMDFLEDQDRKSTRLNSSHVKISYAVFCLKKKKR